MSSHLQEDGSFINSIVGEGTTFRGNLELNGLLRIDGDFSGTIRTAGKVLVGVNGRAECTINAGTVVVGGVVKGNIYAGEKVLVLSTGMMIGNISTPRLIAEEGVVLHGSCLVQTQPDKKLAESMQEPAISEDDDREDLDPTTSDGASRNEETVFSGARDGERSWNA